MNGSLSRYVWPWIAVLLTGLSCAQTGTTYCGDGFRCPMGSLCVRDGPTTWRCEPTTVCGDGIAVAFAGEACDDGNQIGGDGCSANCRSDESCGNGMVDSAAGEVCDDGDEMGGDGCSADCTSNEVCGNGIVDSAAGEACDDEGETANCDTDCTFAACGDGLINTTAGEVCDDAGESAECDTDCTFAACGDGLVNMTAGESCDDAGESAACDNDCTVALCGDGHLNMSAGEICDDAGESATCDTDCTGAACGDDYLNISAGEICDDAGESATCDSDCTLAACGDGSVNATAGEACDDGAESANCDVDCTFAVCGDGLVNGTAGEVCDDAGESATCDSDCTVPACGDGTVNTTADEQCDDGNMTDLDGCSSACAWTLQAVVAGTDHGCARLADGAVLCWGRGASGRLGYGAITDIGDDETPASAGNVSVGGPVAQLAAGGEHTCAVLATGNVRCWGENGDGQLGYGHMDDIGDDETPDSAGPVSVGGSVVQIATGAAHTCALLLGGSVRCWGNNADGQLGYEHVDSIGDNELPASAGDVSIGDEVVQIVAGDAHSCALLSTGQVRCWGGNAFGQLGYGNIDNIGDDPGEMPPSVVNLGGGVVVQLVAGELHTCALLDDGRVPCWGGNDFGQLGYGHTVDIGDDPGEMPPPAVSIGGVAVQLAAGQSHTCARLTTGAVRCWGLNSDGQLGYGNMNSIGDDEAPASAGSVNVGNQVTLLTAGGYHTCAVLRVSRTMRCWGQGTFGQLGYGNTDSIGDNEAPASAGDVTLW